VNHWLADLYRVCDRSFDTAPKVGDPIGYRSNAPFTSIPVKRAEDLDEFELAIPQPAGNFGNRIS